MILAMLIGRIEIMVILTAVAGLPFLAFLRRFGTALREKLQRKSIFR
jgi:hypothetical protein